MPASSKRSTTLQAYAHPAEMPANEATRVAMLLDAVSRAYHGDRDAIEAFLGRPHPLLEGETPFDMARSSSAGAEAVLNLIRRAEAGVAV